MVGKRPRRPAPATPAPGPTERPPWAESHSGEGSASALEMLQMLEDRRVAARPTEPHAEEEPPKAP